MRYMILVYHNRKTGDRSIDCVVIAGFRKKHTLTPTLSRKRERGYILSPSGCMYFISLSRLRERVGVRVCFLRNSTIPPRCDDCIVMKYMILDIDY